MKQDFWLPLICDKDGTTYSASKGNIMCWIAFIAIIVLAFIEVLDTNEVVANTEDVNETMKYLFSTTFLYSIGNKGVNVLDKKKKK